MYFSKNDLIEVRGDQSVETREDGHLGVLRPFSLDNTDGILILLLICFILFSRIYKGGISFFRENTRLLLSNRQSSNLFIETTITEFWFNFILLFQSILLAAIVAFDLIMESDTSTIIPNVFYVIILFVIAITIFILFKILIYRFLGYVFELEDYRKILEKAYIIVLEMLGMIAFVPTLILVYSQSTHSILMYFFIGLFVLSKIILLSKIIVFFLRQHINLLFLIVYLCSVEIIPYFILLKVLIYLYKIDLISLLWL